MITTQWYNAFPMPLLGIASSQSATLISAISQSPGFEVCACNGCDFIEEAYVKNGGSWWQNDTKSFIRAKVVSSDTIVYTLLKDGVQVAVLNSNTYGTFYDFGSLENSDYKGFVIDWDLVQQAFGYGYYTIKTTHTSLGTTLVYESHKFHVVEYNAERADGTIRIEWYQSGSIMNGFDYTGLGWYQSLRIKGKFGDKTPTLVIDNYQDSNRVVKQIQSKIENTYTLETELLPAYIFDVINEDGILGNDIYITDYNLLNQHLFRRFNVYPSNIKDVTNHSLSKKSNFTYEFKEKQDNIIKRNIDGDWGITPMTAVETKYVIDKTIILKFHFSQDELEMESFTIDTDSAGTYTSIEDDGLSGTITLSKNGGSFTAFSNPLVLEDTDTIVVKRTISTSAGFVKLNGIRD